MRPTTKMVQSTRYTRLCSALPLALLITATLAVPSATYHTDINSSRVPWKISDTHTSTPVKPHSYLTRVTGFLDGLFRVQEVTFRQATPLTKSRVSTQLLAQYGDQLVLRFSPTTENEARSLAEACDILFLDIWASSEDWVDVRISKDSVSSLLGLLPSSIKHIPLMQGDELVQAVANTYPSSIPFNVTKLTSRRKAASILQEIEHLSSIFFTDFQPFGVIQDWMQYLESLFDDHVQLVKVGTSYEGRDITALRVGGRRSDPSEPRKTVIVTAGQHAREWISVSTVNYVAYSLITKYLKPRSEIRTLLDTVDILFVPTLNPDGYEYSFTSDRLWRKNRQPTDLAFCPGVDLDRCWNFKWDGQRTMDNPCSESFAGHEPFAAVEVRSFASWARNEIEQNNVNFIGYLDLHSYSQDILYPYSYSCGETPPTLENLEEMGQGLAKAIRGVNGQNYKVMPACEGNVAAVANGNVSIMMDGSGGSALDWFYHELGIRQSFQIKLPDKGSYGFLLPKDYIVPTGLEIQMAVEWLATEMTSSSIGRGRDREPVSDL